MITHEDKLKNPAKKYIIKYIGPYNQEFIDQTIRQYDNADYVIIINVNDKKTSMEVTVTQNQTPSGNKELLLESDNTNTGC